MRYGLPYKGSKNAIAKWVVSQLPKAEYFVDLFFGGGAVTHCAMLSCKYDKFIANDIDGRLPKLFVDCAYGKYTVENHPEWISREDFHRLKADNAYIALVWSFGNNGKDYLYGRNIEEMKHAYHRAVYDNDIGTLLPYGYKLMLSKHKSIYERYLDYQRQIKKQTPNIKLEIVTRQNEIERLQRLQSLQSLQRLQSLQSDYQAVSIPENAVIYCDPPYNQTNCGKYDGFDSERFYAWAGEQTNIFISEYSMPDNFIPIAYTEKTILSAANGNSHKAKEYIFTNQKTWDTLDDDMKMLYMSNMACQMSFL